MYVVVTLVRYLGDLGPETGLNGPCVHPPRVCRHTVQLYNALSKIKWDYANEDAVSGCKLASFPR